MYIHNKKKFVNQKLNQVQNRKLQNEKLFVRQEKT